MRELALHILDLIENSIGAGASIIVFTLCLNPQEDLLEIVVEDNGRGLDVPAETATDPFYTTKKGKRTGLGLSLFRAAAERANGTVSLSRGELGGLRVKSCMQLGHIDRSPLGDIAGTLSSVICTNPELDLRCCFSVGSCEYTVRTSDLANGCQGNKIYGLTLARQMHQRIRDVLAFFELHDWQSIKRR